MKLNDLLKSLSSFEKQQSHWAVTMLSAKHINILIRLKMSEENQSIALISMPSELDRHFCNQ